MTKKDYQIIAGAIWRSGFLKDKNAIRQQAKEDVRRLIVSDLIGSLKVENPRFSETKFLKECGIES